MLSSALLVLASYLWGAVPSAYLLGRRLKGIDVRRHGSGNVGASNVMVLMGRWTGLWLGAFDSLGKGTLPVVVAKLMDESLAVQAVAGLAAIAGHNWSPYIRFTGGRGVATAIGVLIGLLMWKELLIGALILGVMWRPVSRDTGIWTLVMILAVPVLAYLIGEPAELVYASGAILLLLMLKRLTANWETPRGEYSLPRVLAYRLLWDRDVQSRDRWTDRRPPSEGKG
jgi:glycerol-3-phosphate acyltransferase PlsY